MTAGLFVRLVAETDVREAAFWYEGKRGGLGAEFILELGRFPHATYFLAGEETIIVIAVLHQHRRSQAWRERV